MKTGIQWSAVIGAAMMSLGVGLMAGAAAVERKVREEYAESAASYRRAMEMARTISGDSEGPHEHLEVESEVLEVPEEVPAYTPVKPEKLQVVRDLDAPNDYHKAMAATETGVQAFVDGGVNDYGVSYIEEEEFNDDSEDRFKGQITIVMDEHNPTFFMDGIQITNWDELIGDSILVDFYRLVPPGIDQVLYVRNHRRDEDYEVSREQP